MYKGINKQRMLELNQAVSKLDFVDFEKACDYLANYIDFFSKLHEQMPNAIKEFTPDYTNARALLSELLHNKDTSTMFKHIALDYIKNIYYENQIKNNAEDEKFTKIIKFKKNN